MTRGIGDNSKHFEENEGSGKTTPSVEEARIVFQAIAYFKFKIPDLEDFLAKRKGGVKMGWRLVLCNVIKDDVRQDSLRQLLDLNRKTMGENQQRADRWAEYDEENGDGRFGEMVAALRAAVVADRYVDAEELGSRLKDFVRIDPALRKLEEQRRLHELAAREAEEKAAALQASIDEKARLKRAGALRDSLKGVPGRDAIVAEHKGAPHLAKTIGEGAVEVIRKVVKAEAKGARRLASELDASGLKECKRLGLVRESVPHLAPPLENPPILPTDLGRRVFVEAVKLKRIVMDKKSRKRAA